ncbi:MAG: Rieske 2Fe-2S domain-containing protein [Pseudomonadota bacterium]|jgi:nitrite reductase/ring-hydroxylating ferredoxin subunit
MNQATATFHPLERADRLHDGYLRAFDVGGLHLVLVQQGGVPAVLEGYCPHAGHPLDGSRLVGGDLRCDMHGYLFDAHSGVCTYWTEGPCRGLKVYPCEVRGGAVGVLL